MNRLVKFFTVIFVVLFSSSSFAQDMQIRIPTHIQPQSDGLGMAGWAVLPNVLAENNQGATLLVAGMVWKNKLDWLEIMGGVHRSQTGYTDPLINIRFQESPLKQLAVSGEIQQTFKSAKRRTLWWLVLDTPTPFFKARVGVEIENINFWSGKYSYGLGPRVSLPIPLYLPHGTKLSVAYTYQFKTGNDFGRVYILTNIRL